jgi:succinyl-CoA--D-citramalate CoA-transferase
MPSAKDGDPVMAEPQGGALTGLRVIDLGTMIAGPLCCTLMADHGADVIKIEQPRVGDPLRAWTPMVDGVSLWWKVTARNKRLVTLNLGHPDGARLFKRLMSSADIVVENFRPGTMEKWGLGYPQLEALHPGIILVRISGFGQTGPYSQRPGYGTVAEAMSGMPAFTGVAGGAPQLSSFPLADTVAATFAALGAVMAIYNRYQTGRGQEIDVSLFEPLFRLVESQVIAYDQLGLVKKRVGNRLEEDAPRNVYETSDGKYLVLSASSPRTWARLTSAMDRVDLLADPRFENNASRCANVDALDAIVGAWMRTHTLQDAMATFELHDVVAGPIYDIEDIFHDAQFQARQAIVQVVDPDLGTVKMPDVVPRFGRTPGGVRHPGLGLGHDNEAVYRGELGLDEREYEQLRSAGAV